MPIRIQIGIGIISRAFVALIVFWIMPQIVQAQGNDDIQKCFEETVPNLAIHFCTRVIQSGGFSNENLSASYNRRGNVYFNKGNYDQAIQDYNQAIRLNPEFGFAFNNRGSAYRAKEDYDRAIQDYNQAIRLKPDYAFAFNNRGNAYSAKEDYDRAIQDYNETIRLKPDFALAFNSRGSVYSLKKDYDRAIQDYNEAIRLNPDYAFAFNSRGSAYSAKGDYLRANQDYNQMVRLRPEDGWAFYLRGLFRYDHGHFSDAKKDFVKARELEYSPMYVALRIYLSQDTLRENVTETLEKNVEGLDLNSWPGPIIKMYLGRIEHKEVFGVTKKAPDALERSAWECEYYYYTGEYLHRHSTLKIDLQEFFFRDAIEKCPVSFEEYQSAKAYFTRKGK